MGTCLVEAKPTFVDLSVDNHILNQPHLLETTISPDHEKQKIRQILMNFSPWDEPIVTQATEDKMLGLHRWEKLRTFFIERNNLGVVEFQPLEISRYGRFYIVGPQCEIAHTRITQIIGPNFYDSGENTVFFYVKSGDLERIFSLPLAAEFHFNPLVLERRENPITHAVEMNSSTFTSEEFSLSGTGEKSPLYLFMTGIHTHFGKVAGIKVTG